MIPIGDDGQAVPLFLAFAAVALGSVLVGLGVASASIVIAERQSAADVAALAGADALRLGARPEEAAAVAESTSRANGFRARASVPDAASPLPSRVRVTVHEPIALPGVGIAPIRVMRSAEAMVAVPAGMDVAPGPGDYQGPFSWRQGRPMRPDVAIAFDRMEAAAARAGVHLVIASAWRSTSEQAQLFAAHPDPKWVARPGQSLHRLGTELDLGPPSAYGWLAANAGSFGFLKRYAWEPWHFGYVRSPGSTSVGWGLRRPATGGRPAGRDRGGSRSLPSWVPGRYAAAILTASVRNGVSAALLAAQLRAESDFDPSVVSSAGARGIAQLMPDEARRFGVDPFDPTAAIGAQARLMREHLSRFGSVPLALAAYNAGPGAVARCGCIPPYPETRAYVARIIGWLDGTGSDVAPVVLVA